MLCGASPTEASLGKTRRHRLNRGGDRQANTALHRIVVARLRHDRRTQDYLARRLSQGKSRKEAIRCLIGRVSAAVTRSPGSWLLGRRQGTAPLLCRRTAGFSPAAPGAPRP
jgi:Transposase IS116/IS110/IS902 family